MGLMAIEASLNKMNKRKKLNSESIIGHRLPFHL